MSPRRRRFASLAVLLAASSELRCSGLHEPLRETSGASEARAADAEIVTAESLLANERYWPYQASLTRDWIPEGRARALASGTRGVLIRVEEGELARMDFGRGGVQRVSVASTDLVALANRVRTRELPKEGPNFAIAIRQRLVDSAADELRPRSGIEILDATGFLCVFADPDAASTAELAAALVPLRDRAGLETIFFPQARHSDAEIRLRLRSLGWSVPFLYAHLSKPYTHSLIDPETPLPAVLLLSAEGRVWLARAGLGGNLSELAAELDRAIAAQNW